MLVKFETRREDVLMEAEEIRHSYEGCVDIRGAEGVIDLTTPDDAPLNENYAKYSRRMRPEASGGMVTVIVVGYDGSVKQILTDGPVYIMNNDGKTIDTI